MQQHKKKREEKSQGLHAIGVLMLDAQISRGSFIIFAQMHCIGSVAKNNDDKSTEFPC